jgi:hypothetical protein
MLKDFDYTKWTMKTDYTHELKGVKTVVKVGSGGGLSLESEVNSQYVPGLKITTSGERKGPDAGWTGAVRCSTYSMPPPFRPTSSTSGRGP